jgi:hypothetical protein
MTNGLCHHGPIPWEIKYKSCCEKRENSYEILRSAMIHMNLTIAIPIPLLATNTPCIGNHHMSNCIISSQAKQTPQCVPRSLSIMQKWRYQNQHTALGTWKIQLFQHSFQDEAGWDLDRPHEVVTMERK